MSKKIVGYLNGAGSSAMYVGLGFIPDALNLLMADQAAAENLVWDKHMIRAATMAEGILRTTIGADDAGLTVLTDGNGVEVYYGGDIIAAQSDNYVIPKSHPAVAALFGGDQRAATAGTLVDRAIRTSDAATKIHVNTALNTTYVGVGSEILIEPDAGGPVKRFAIVALSNDGTTVDDITLNNAAVAGKIRFIGYKFDYVPAPVGVVMPAGFRINESTYINVNDQRIRMIAEQW